MRRLRQSDRGVIILAMALLILATLGFFLFGTKSPIGQSDQWSTFTPPPGDFSVSMPQNPSLTSEQHATAVDNIPYIQRTYSSAGNGATVFVFQYIYAKPVDISDPKSLFGQLTNAAASAVGGTLATSSYGTYQGHSSYDVVIDGPHNLTAKGRMIIIDAGEQYFIEYVADTDQFDETRYESFINSLEINR